MIRVLVNPLTGLCLGFLVTLLKFLEAGKFRYCPWWVIALVIASPLIIKYAILAGVEVTREAIRVWSSPAGEMSGAMFFMCGEL